ncbi:MAG: hypothetical protein ABIK89_10610 [Planctomycetota bacterium]
MRRLTLGLVALAGVALAASTVEAGTFSAPAAGHASVTLVAHHGHGGFRDRPGYSYRQPHFSHHPGRARVHPPMIVYPPVYLPVYPPVYPYRSLYGYPYGSPNGSIYYRGQGFGISLGF